MGKVKENNSKVYKWREAKINYDKQGKKNVTSFPDFIEVCKKSQKQLKRYLIEKLVESGYTDIINDDGYIYAKGSVPVLLTAHMDTVHKNPVKDFYEFYNKEKGQHIISSPQGIGGDDRCGIYIILEVIKDYKPSILFCEDEEIGGVGSDKFCKTEFIMELSGLNYLIELDRMNGSDAVFYDCANDEFTKFIEDNTGYKESWGSFSDISNLAPVCGVAAVNLSCGYYNAHTTSEYVVMEEMFNTIEVVKNLLALDKVPQFEYIENVYNGFYRGYYGYGNYGKWYDDYDEDYSYKNKGLNQVNEIGVYQFIWYEKDNEEQTDIAYGYSIEEAVGSFLMKHTDLSFNDIYDYYEY